MSILIIVDPGWHAEAESEARIYEDKGGLALHLKGVRKYTGCDVFEIAGWVARLKQEWSSATLKIESNGPGLAIIQILEEHIKA